jgi:hypothetical protein
MINTCGHTHFHSRQNTEGFYIEQNNGSLFLPQHITSTPTQLYTSYLGMVTVNVTQNTDNTVSLETYHIVNGKQILVKIVDAQENNLKENEQYPLNKLKSLPSKKINIADNTFYYVANQLCNKKFAQLNQNIDLVTQLNTIITPLLANTELFTKLSVKFPELMAELPTKSITEYKNIYKNIVTQSDHVDIFFNTTNYLDFLYLTTQLTSVNKLDALISISNVPNLDNAFFTGEYMCFGSGDKMFYPLSSIDVCGHELSHGLVSGTANLEYKGHSGALNESFSDIMGTMFEFYMYDKYPHLNGKSDWMIGEDIAINQPYLRSMQNPNGGKQPNKFKGQFYVDPNSQQDYGGVHTNSGITNYCFYLACQQKEKSLVLPMFIKCLYSLNKTSNLANFRDQLKNASNYDSVILAALTTVGLDDNMISDYNGTNDQRGPRGQDPRRDDQRGPGGQDPRRDDQRGPGRQDPRRDDQRGPGRQDPRRDDQRGPGRQDPRRDDQRGPGRQDPRRDDQRGPGRQDPRRDDQRGPGRQDPRRDDQRGPGKQDPRRNDQRGPGRQDPRRDDQRGPGRQDPRRDDQYPNQNEPQRFSYTSLYDSELYDYQFNDPEWYDFGYHNKYYDNQYDSGYHNKHYNNHTDYYEY